MRVIFMLLALLLSGNPAWGATADDAGIVKSMKGKVVIIRRGAIISAEPNLRLFKGDTVRTGSNGTAGLILEDDTVISMGRNTKLVIEKFLFRPYEKKLGLIVRIIEGTASFVSGQIAKLAPSRVHIEVPNATVGVRGTHILIEVH